MPRGKRAGTAIIIGLVLSLLLAGCLEAPGGTDPSSDAGAFTADHVEAVEGVTARTSAGAASLEPGDEGFDELAREALAALYGVHAVHQRAFLPGQVERILNESAFVGLRLEERGAVELPNYPPGRDFGEAYFMLEAPTLESGLTGKVLLCQTDPFGCGEFSTHHDFTGLKELAHDMTSLSSEVAGPGDTSWVGHEEDVLVVALTPEEGEDTDLRFDAPAFVEVADDDFFMDPQNETIALAEGVEPPEAWRAVFLVGDRQYLVSESARPMAPVLVETPDGEVSHALDLWFTPHPTHLMLEVAPHTLPEASKACGVSWTHRPAEPGQEAATAGEGRVGNAGVWRAFAGDAFTLQFGGGSADACPNLGLEVENLGLWSKETSPGERAAEPCARLTVDANRTAMHPGGNVSFMVRLENCGETTLTVGPGSYCSHANGLNASLQKDERAWHIHEDGAASGPPTVNGCLHVYVPPREIPPGGAAEAVSAWNGTLLDNPECETADCEEEPYYRLAPPGTYEVTAQVSPREGGTWSAHTTLQVLDP